MHTHTTNTNTHVTYSQEAYNDLFAQYYATVHRLETNKLRNVAKIFGHLMHTDALAWTCLEYIQLNEDDTTSSSRIFIKILFQEISEYLGLPKLKERLEGSPEIEILTLLIAMDEVGLTLTLTLIRNLTLTLTLTLTGVPEP